MLIVRNSFKKIINEHLFICVTYVQLGESLTICKLGVEVIQLGDRICIYLGDFVGSELVVTATLTVPSDFSTGTMGVAHSEYWIGSIVPAFSSLSISSLIFSLSA